MSAHHSDHTQGFVKESPKEFDSRFNANPENLGYKCWSLFGEWGDNFDGVLTYELEGAPREFKMGHWRCSKKMEYKLKSGDLWNDQQLEDTFGAEASEFIAQTRRVHGTQILSLADIKVKADLHAAAKKAAGKLPGPSSGASAVGGASLGDIFASMGLPVGRGGSAGTSVLDDSASNAGSDLPGNDGASVGGASQRGSGISLTAATLQSHASAHQSQSPGSVASGMPPLHNSSAGSVRSMPRRAASAQQLEHSPSDKTSDDGDEKLPSGLSQEGRWDWKLNQLSLYGALEGEIKRGRERNTARMYAKDAMEHGNEIGAKLLARATQHENYENIAMGASTRGRSSS